VAYQALQDTVQAQHMEVFLPEAAAAGAILLLHMVLQEATVAVAVQAVADSVVEVVHIQAVVVTQADTGKTNELN